MAMNSDILCKSGLMTIQGVPFKIHNTYRRDVFCGFVKRVKSLKKMINSFVIKSYHRLKN